MNFKEELHFDFSLKKIGTIYLCTHKYVRHVLFTMSKSRLSLMQAGKVLSTVIVPILRVIVNSIYISVLQNQIIY